MQDFSMNKTSDQPRKIIPDQSSALKNQDHKSQKDAENEQRELERSRSEHKRDQVSRQIMAYGSYILMAAIWLSIIGAVFTVSAHTLTNFGWLSEEDYRTVKNFVLSGAVVGLGTTYLKKYFY